MAIWPRDLTFTFGDLKFTFRFVSCMLIDTLIINISDLHNQIYGIRMIANVVWSIEVSTREYWINCWAALFSGAGLHCRLSTFPNWDGRCGNWTKKTVSHQYLARAKIFVSKIVKVIRWFIMIFEILNFLPSNSFEKLNYLFRV